MAAAAVKLFTPRPYQDLIVDHIVQHPRCAVWAGMGLGKTVSTLTALEAIDALSGDAYPALALGPLRVARKVWNEETQKWAHTKDVVSVSKVIGSVDQRTTALKYHAQIYSMNYENVPWLIEHFNGRWPFRTIIPDESRKLKAYRTKQGGAMTKALAKVAWHPNVKHFIELTGTPSPNGLRDLWGQLWYLDQGQRLGRTYTAFEQRWFGYKRIRDVLRPGKSHVLPVIQQGADADIHRLVHDLCLSIRAADWFDVKEPINVVVKVELPPFARKLYNEMERKLFIQIENHEVEAFSAGAKTMKLLQLANGAAYLDPDVSNDDDPRNRAFRVTTDAKIEALESVIDEAEGMPIIVAVQFKSDIARLLKAIPGSRLMHSERDEDDFKAGLIPVLIAHPKSAGHGIDGFQDVTNIIAFFGHWWDLELRQQIIERIGPVRQIQSGNDRPVFVYDIVAEDTIDEDVIARHATKRSVQDLLLEATKRRRHA